MTIERLSDRKSKALFSGGPYLTLSDEFIEKNSPTLVKREFFENFLVKKLDNNSKEELLKRIQYVHKNVGSIIDEIENKYGHKVVHVSVAGSFSYKREALDLDLNVIVEGSIFDYYEDRSKLLHVDSLAEIKKVSFLVFGEDNLFSDVMIDDTIPTESFLHQDLIAREMTIAAMRNITIYGKSIAKNDIDIRNVVVRLVRQLYFGRKILEGEISRYTSPKIKLSKAISRFFEAEMILLWLIEDMDSKQNDTH